MENNPDPSNPKYADNLGLVLKQVIKNPEKIKNILAELHESRIKYLDVLKKKLEQDVSVSHVKNEKLLKID
ncbi:MAG: hypothetical protein LBQ24_06775 [Candidatus Peribacteria bacterium]|jgi:hypothetical protein|nr:hypothetical protein [Candidatus Peribacteria bacterium]